MSDTGKIEYLKYDDEKSTSILSSAFSNNNLIPVIGSGFTRNSPTSKGAKVPSGDDFKDIMIDIIKHNKKFEQSSVDKLKTKKFSEISDLFFNKDWVPEVDVKLCLNKYFTNVKLSQDKINFICDIKWPYIYTLNVDSAVESNSYYKVALPYDSSLSHSSKNHPTLYKLHGDIEYEIRHDVSRLIFKRSDYLASLENNRAMLNLLKIDLQEKNIIYIGCSLSDEIDLAFLMAIQSQDNRKKTRNIIFLDAKPDEIDGQEYINFGIDCVILYDKDQYHQIYMLINKAYQISATKTNELDPFRIKIKHLDAKKSDNEDFLIKGIVDLNNSTGNTNHIVPYFYTERNIEKDVHDSLLKYDITIIKGPRVSGRTILSYNVLNNIKDRNIFIVDSTNKINSYTLNKLIGQQNSIVFFDSLALDNESIKRVKSERKFFSRKNLSLLICADEHYSDEEFLLGEAGSSTNIISLRNKFTSNEISVLNRRAIEAKLPTFSDKRYILDNIYNIFKILGEDNLIRKIATSHELFVILFVISTKYNITGQELIYTEFDIEKTLGIVRQHSPFLEIEVIKNQEQYDHTSYKISSYANSWVVSVIREFYRAKGKVWCVDALFSFFKTCYPKDKSLVILMRKFDNLNHILSDGKHGAADFIIGLYDKLIELEGKEPEFYVQKAKAYYNIYQGENICDAMLERIKELNVALTWARSSNNNATERNIIHIRALLWLKRIVTLNEISENDLRNSMESIFEALSNDRNYSYKETLLKSSSTSAIILKQFIVKVDSISGSHPFMLTMKAEWDDLKSRIGNN